ncbi:hypothetical protein BDZ94DRAFT_1232252 [Collybia nuda]|uniref:Uncharacterized protein n=1 Tax=Collybia nuda TaxID=64659 RepID=A0A9P5YHF7_9AGAR|nr:hypothetical protein BDZ94DRAFT_1232252 [Collybia nuda]
MTEVDQDWNMDEAPPYSGPLFVFLLLCFYALALWDRWLNLKIKTEENRRLHAVMDKLQSYGTIASAKPLTKLKAFKRPLVSDSAAVGSQVMVSSNLFPLVLGSFISNDFSNGTSVGNELG